MVKSSMRSPRRVNFAHEALQSISLNDKSPVPEDSISWKLWLACQDIAQQALETQYIQGIKNGDLDPNQYGQYTIQDAVYCYHAQQDYQTLETRSQAEGYDSLASFAKARAASYESYNQDTFKAWHIQDPQAVAPGDAAQTYINFEHNLATTQQPIYGVIGMIPCDQLWSYLATELKDAADPKNLYSFWINENNDWGGSYRLDNFVDDWFAAYPDVYDWDTALFVFRSCMTCELNFFRSACGEELLPMPEKKETPE